MNIWWFLFTPVKESAAVKASRNHQLGDSAMLNKHVHIEALSHFFTDAL